MENLLTHWCRVTHICVSKLTIICSDNGLSPGQHQAITWTNVGILLIGPLGTNFSEMLIEIRTFSFKKIHLKMSSGKWRPFCLGLNVLRTDILHCTRSQVTKALWAHNSNLVKICVALMGKMTIRSGHNFAHVKTTDLSWHANLWSDWIRIIIKAGKIFKIEIMSSYTFKNWVTDCMHAYIYIHTCISLYISNIYIYTYVYIGCDYNKLHSIMTWLLFWRKHKNHWNSISFTWQRWLHHGCWWPGDTRSLSISRPGINQVFHDYFSLSSRRADTAFNSSPPSAAYMRQGTRPALVKIVACRLLGAKPLSKTMLVHCQLDP